MKKYLQFLALTTTVYSAFAFALPNTIYLGVNGDGKSTVELEKIWKPVIDNIQTALRRDVKIQDIASARGGNFDMIVAPCGRESFYEDQGYQRLGRAQSWDPTTGQFTEKTKIRLLVRRGTSEEDVVSARRFGMIGEHAYASAEALKQWSAERGAALKEDYLVYPNITSAVAALKRREIDGVPVDESISQQYPEFATLDMGYIDNDVIMVKGWQPAEIEAVKAALAKGPFHDDTQK